MALSKLGTYYEHGREQARLSGTATEEMVIGKAGAVVGNNRKFKKYAAAEDVFYGFVTYQYYDVAKGKEGTVPQEDTAYLAQEGKIYVQATEAVSIGDPVYLAPSGTVNKTSGKKLDAVFNETIAAAGPVKIILHSITVEA